MGDHRVGRTQRFDRKAGDALGGHVGPLVYADKVANWAATPRYSLGAALRVLLGYSANSENAAELEEALQKLIELKPNSIWLDEEASSVPLLVSGEVVLALGWVYDIQTAQEELESVEYILPQEGTLLWGDNFVIPANSPNKAAAEALLNFLLRPEIAAQIINEGYYPVANDAALQYVNAELLNDPTVYPSNGNRVTVNCCCR